MFAATKSFFTNEATAGGLSPSWVLDFSVGTPSGYTFTRSANTATYVESSGYIASAWADVPRLTHDKNGNRLGLLVEQQRTNLVLYSEQFNQSGAGAWTGLFNVTVGTNVATSPDNTNTADELIENTASGNHRIVTAARTVSQSLLYTASCYIKANNRNYCAIILYAAGGTGCRFGQVFDLTGSGSLGSTASFSSPTGTSATITSVGNGWFRVTVTMESQTNTSIQVSVSASNSATPTFASQAPSYVGAGTSAIYVWGAQMEQGAATSYIPTTNVTVVRNNDLAYVLDSGITGWQSPGGLVVHFYPPTQTGAIISTEDAIAEQLGIQCNTVTTARAYWSSGNTSTSTLTTGVQKAVHYWNGTASSFCLNAGTVHTQTNNVTTFGNIDFVTFGAQASDNAGIPGLYSSFTNVIIRKIEFYGQTLTSADLQTITA